MAETSVSEVALGITPAAQVVARKLKELFPDNVMLTEQAIRDFCPRANEIPGDLDGISREAFSLEKLEQAIFGYFTIPQVPVGWPEIWHFLRQHAPDCLQDPSRRNAFKRHCGGDCLTCDLHL